MKTFKKSLMAANIKYIMYLSSYFLSKHNKTYSSLSWKMYKLFSKLESNITYFCLGI